MDNNALHFHNVWRREGGLCGVGWVRGGGNGIKGGGGRLRITAVFLCRFLSFTLLIHSCDTHTGTDT